MPEKPPPPNPIPLRDSPDSPIVYSSSGWPIGPAFFTIILGALWFCAIFYKAPLKNNYNIQSHEIVVEIKAPEGVRCFQLAWHQGAEGLSCFPVNK
jgi:hypothetical protein